LSNPFFGSLGARCSLSFPKESITLELSRLSSSSHQGHLCLSLTDERHLFEVSLEVSVFPVLADVRGYHHEYRTAVYEYDGYDVVERTHVIVLLGYGMTAVIVVGDCSDERSVGILIYSD